MKQPQTILLSLSFYRPQYGKYDKGYVFSLTVNRGWVPVVQNFATICPTNLAGGWVPVVQVFATRCPTELAGGSRFNTTEVPPTHKKVESCFEIFCGLFFWVFVNYFLHFFGIFWQLLFDIFFCVFGHDQAGRRRYASCGHTGGLSCSYGIYTLHGTGTGTGTRIQWVILNYAEVFTLLWDRDRDLKPLCPIVPIPFPVPVPVPVPGSVYIP